MTHTLIVYAHPWTGSLNHAILEAVTSALEAAGRPYDVIDLLADGFDPCYDAAELAREYHLTAEQIAADTLFALKG